MPVHAIKVYTSPSPLLQMGQFLMDKNCTFFVLFADDASRKIIFTTVISESSGREERLKAEIPTR